MSAGLDASVSPLPSRSVLRVGLTGGIGSGKSFFADLLVELGATMIDTDQLARELTAPHGAALPAIENAFGPSVFLPDGTLDRAGLRAVVFADPSARKALEAILHPLIRAGVDAAIRACTAPYILIVIPLLVESGDWRARLDEVVVVDCPEELQVARVMQRSGLGRDQVLAIMRAQATRAQRLAVADHVVSNGHNTSLESLRARAKELHAHWCARANGMATIGQEGLPAPGAGEGRA